MNRRAFLKLTTLALSLSTGMPKFLARAASLGEGEKILLVIQLSGGNDGLNTLIPFTNGAYYAARPSIAIPKKAVIPVSTDLAMHPNLRPLAKLFDDGNLAFIENVGYPNASRSHFESMATWHSADPSKASKEGWIGRIAEQLGDPFCATSISTNTPPSLQTQNLILPSISKVEDFKVSIPDYLTQAYNDMLHLAREGEAKFVQNSTLGMLEHTTRIQTKLDTYKAAASYPDTTFAKALQQVATLITIEAGQRIHYVSLGGFDTHADQLTQHADLMDILATGLVSFYEDIKGQGLQDKVAVLAFSEFGRRVAENGSGGTDHGQGGVMFSLGAGIKGGIYGDSPDLEKLNKGDIIYQQDFRGVYARVLEDWLGLKADDVLAGNYKGPSFIA